MAKLRVLFVCVENSGRSQMAEGFARFLGDDVWETWSAGSRPSGKVNPTAVAAMKELGIDISKHKSKGLNALPPGEWDYVITLGCGDACPHLPARHRDDWPLPDPKNMPLADLRVVRDAIEKRVMELLAASQAAYPKGRR